MTRTNNLKHEIIYNQLVFASAQAYVNDISEVIFKVGMCMLAGPFLIIG